MPVSLASIKSRATQDPMKDINWEAATTGGTLKSGKADKSDSNRTEIQKPKDEVNISPEAREKKGDSHEHDSTLTKWAHNLTNGWF